MEGRRRRTGWEERDGEAEETGRRRANAAEKERGEAGRREDEIKRGRGKDG